MSEPPTPPRQSKMLVNSLAQTQSPLHVSICFEQFVCAQAMHVPTDAPEVFSPASVGVAVRRSASVTQASSPASSLGPLSATEESPPGAPSLRPESIAVPGGAVLEPPQAAIATATDATDPVKSFFNDSIREPPRI